MDYEKFSNCVDKNQQDYVSELKDWVAVKSVSGDYTFRKECFSMIDLIAEKLKELDFEVSVVENPVKVQKVPDVGDIPLPPVILASKFKCEKLKTVCIYGHADVQPAKFSDGWFTEPFDLVEKEGKLIGRGSTDDKGPVLGWICALKALKEIGYDPKINIKLCIECMEESGSVGLEELLIQEKNKFFKDVDCVCISDSYWLGAKKPCISYGLRGVMYYQLKISGFSQDLHSGLYGGAVYEPMVDLVNLLSSLVSNDGKILIPGVYDDVDPVTEKETKTYGPIDFDIEEFKNSFKAEKLTSDDKTELLMKMWRYPSLSVHGIEGAFSDQGEKTVIPRCVIGKFSLRIVPSMSAKKTDKLIREHLEKQHKALSTPNKMDIYSSHGDDAWVADIEHYNYKAAEIAIKKVYEMEPDYTRIGGSIPITIVFDKQLQKNVLLLPVGRFDDGAHSQNEKFDRSNFINGIKLFGAYLDELGKC